MAITIVASVFTSAASGANVTLPIDGAAANDIVVAWGGFAGGTATAPGVISPSGYTSIFSRDDANNDFKVEWKRMGASPDPSVLLAGSGDAADPNAYGVYVLRGITNLTSILSTAVLSTVATGVPQSPSIITVNNGDIILAVGGNDVNDGSPGTVTNFSANIGGGSNDTDDFSAAGAASVIATAGTITPTAWTTWASSNYVTATIALIPATTPTVTTSVVSNISSTTAIGGGNISTDGGSPILQRGVAWHTSTNPTTANSFANTPGTTGFFQSSITGLSPSTHYYTRAFGFNAIGSVYGSNEEFDSSAGASSPPTVVSNTQTDGQNTYVVANGNVTSDGGATITERGIVWATTINPTTSNNKIVVSGTTGAYTALITNLLVSTTYHYRAYAINSQGTSYGTDISWATNALATGHFVPAN